MKQNHSTVHLMGLYRQPGPIVLLTCADLCWRSKFINIRQCGRVSPILYTPTRVLWSWYSTQFRNEEREARSWDMEDNIPRASESSWKDCPISSGGFGGLSKGRMLSAWSSDTSCVGLCRTLRTEQGDFTAAIGAQGGRSQCQMQGLGDGVLIFQWLNVAASASGCVEIQLTGRQHKVYLMCGKSQF